MTERHGFRFPRLSISFWHLCEQLHHLTPKRVKNKQIKKSKPIPTVLKGPENMSVLNHLLTTDDVVQMKQIN